MNRIIVFSALFLTLSLCIGAFCSCADEDVTTPQPDAPPITEEVYDDCDHVDTNDDFACDFCAEYYYDEPNHTVHNMSGSSCLDCAVLESSGGLEFSLNDDGTYSVVGIGSCTNSSIIIGTYNGISVTKIADNAFNGVIGLTEVMINRSVIEIGDRAFYGCTNLQTVYMSRGTRIIGAESFRGCTSIDSMHIADCVTDIGDFAFADCTRMSYLHISYKTKSIGVGAFSGCTALAEIFIPRTTLLLGARVFENCPNLSIYCQRLTQPDGWDVEWNVSNRPVKWGCIEVLNSIFTDPPHIINKKG